MIPIYIPSRGRANRKLGGGHTALSIPDDRLVNYVVPTEEVASYAIALEKIGLGWCGVLGTDIRGIAPTRHHIGRLASAMGREKFVMMDDDLQFYVRRSPEVFNLRYAEKSEVGEAIDWLEISLNNNAHASISAREGNNRRAAGPWPLVTHNTRSLRVLAYRTREFLECEHGRVDVMEDFDINLQLLERGYSNCVSFWWAQGQRMTNEAGGCSTYRTHALHEASARRLAELHPDFVRLRQKTNKTDREGFGTRTEVTIYWKKAYEAGQEALKTGQTDAVGAGVATDAI